MKDLQSKYIYQRDTDNVNYTAKQTIKNKNKTSYSRLHKNRKIIPNENYDYHVVFNHAYIYQGQWAGSEKHGEGIAFLKNGTMIIGHWMKDKLNGRAIIITQYGALLSVFFINNKLNGWMIALQGNRLIISNLFFEDKIDSPRIIYEGESDKWVAATFTKDGSIAEITNFQKEGKREQLPLFVNSDELTELFEQIVIHKDYAFDFNKIQCIEVMSKTQYIGFVDSENMPYGLGATYSGEECFMGYFEKGYLENFGRMIFKNGDIYHGGFSYGSFSGNGMYYNPTKNSSAVVYSSDDNETEVIEEQKGYFLIDFDIKVGLRIDKDDEVWISPGFHTFLNVMERYYEQFYIEKRHHDEERYSNIEQVEESCAHSAIVENNTISPLFIKPERKGSDTKWLINDKENGESEPPSVQDEESMRNIEASKTKERENEVFKFNNQFASVTIKENEDPMEKEKHEKQNPNVTDPKKKLLGSDHLFASKSLDINELTFRGVEKSFFPNDKTLENKKSNISKNPMISFNAITQNKNLDIHQKIQKGNTEFEEQNYSLSRDSSSVSNMDEKMQGIMKKSNLRKRIFE